MIVLENVTYCIGDKVILQNLTFNVKKGEMVAITGRSGSGKSTILNLCGGLIQPTSGELVISGVVNPVYSTSKGRKLLREEVGFIFQNFVLLSEETVEYNFDLIKKFFKSDVEYGECLKMVGLSDEVLTQKVFELSGGEQQRVAIARNLLKPHNIILADEPTGSLDPENRDLILNLLKRMNELGKTILIVTHDENVTIQCDREVVL